MTSIEHRLSPIRCCPDTTVRGVRTATATPTLADQARPSEPEKRAGLFTAHDMGPAGQLPHGGRGLRRRPGL